MKRNTKVQPLHVSPDSGNAMLPAVASGTLRPILFSTEMVKAILDGRKTQTRRLIKGVEKANRYKGHWQPELDGIEVYDFQTGNLLGEISVKCKYNVGDILWVRETWQHIGYGTYNFRADGGERKYGTNGARWMPSIFMPKDACRLFLKVTKIKVQRLQDISEDDAMAEGVEEDIIYNKDFSETKAWKSYVKRFDICEVARISYHTLWEKINGHGSWEKNPFVWVIEFERCVHP